MITSKTMGGRVSSYSRHVSEYSVVQTIVKALGGLI